MSLVLGDPALRLLALRKLRGTLRIQRRRLRTPRGIVFTVLGVLLLGLWMASLLMQFFVGGRPASDPDDLRAKVELGALAVTLFSLSSAFSHRGLHLPHEEIERLFVAPVDRRDLVRYRLLATSARALFGAFFLGLVVSRGMTSPVLGFLGVAVSVLTLPVLNQLVAILAGGIERRWARRLGGARGVLVLLAAAAIGGLVLSTTMDFGSGELPIVGGLLADGVKGFLEHPLVRALRAPFTPWARMITAASLGAFLPWLGVCAAIWLVLFEATARLPLDFRELSLETAASVAQRLRRARRGGGAASGRASARLAGLPVPWLFGRGPFGAIAWRKSAAILRKARGTLLVSAFVLLFLTFVVGRLDQAAVWIAVLGTLYLTAGLRFDFRDELDGMEVIRAWPVAPARVFAAMLLPQVAFVTLLTAAALLLNAIVFGGWSPIALLVLVFQPLFVLSWVAIDNCVFLLAPVRLVPGQEGALQNAGRGFLFMFVRFLVLGAALGGSVLPAAAVVLVLVRLLGLPEDLALRVGAGVSWVGLLGMGLLLVAGGGEILRRFDVARDRG